MLQAKAEVEQGNATKEIALTKRAADLDIREMKFGAEQELAKAKADVQSQIDEQGRAIKEGEIENKRKSAEHEEKTIQEKAKLADKEAQFHEGRAKYASEAADRQERETKGRDQALADLVAEVSKQNKETSAALAALVKAMSAKKRIVRGKDGRAEGVEMMP